MGFSQQPTSGFIHSFHFSCYILLNQTSEKNRSRRSLGVEEEGSEEVQYVKGCYTRRCFNWLCQTSKCCTSDHQIFRVVNIREITLVTARGHFKRAKASIKPLTNGIIYLPFWLVTLFWGKEFVVLR